MQASKLKLRLLLPSQCRSFAVNPPSFIHPIFRAADQEKLKSTNDYERHTFLPVRAAASNQTSSVFFDPLVAKFTNHIMRKGNKILARGLLENTFEEIKRLQLRRSQTNPSAECNPYKLLHKAVANARPLLYTTPVKRGGHTYQVPVPIRPNASLAIALKWLIDAGKEKEDEVRFFVQLAKEIVDTAEGVGKVVKRKQDLHRLCEANRAYAHYRWS